MRFRRYQLESFNNTRISIPFSTLAHNFHRAGKRLFVKMMKKILKEDVNRLSFQEISFSVQFKNKIRYYLGQIVPSIFSLRRYGSRCGNINIKVRKDLNPKIIPENNLSEERIKLEEQLENLYMIKSEPVNKVSITIKDDDLNS